MGVGQHIRSAFRAFRAAGIAAKVRDIYGLVPPDDPSLRREFQPSLSPTLSRRVNIFHINGDEVDQVLAHLGGLPPAARNIIYPLWELSTYPAEWARRLDLFDEVWAPSRFVFEAASRAVTKPVIHMPVSSEPRMARCYGRRYFGIPESPFVFLFFFDFRSYVHRKNPFAVLGAFERVGRQLPYAPIVLLIKLNGQQQAPDDYQTVLRNFRNSEGRVVILDCILEDDEIKSLVRCCDCFVSLHRSEGVGLGMAEAMFLGKPVVATAYSGNLDFMTADNSCLVHYRLVPVEEGQYPHANGQVWADPDIDHAAWYMRRLFEDPEYAWRLGRMASRHMRTHFSDRARGLRYARRLEAIA